MNAASFEPMVETERLSSNGIEIRCQAWLHAKATRDTAKVSSALLIRIAQCISASGCDFSFPRIILETGAGPGSGSASLPLKGSGTLNDATVANGAAKTAQKLFPWDMDR